MIVTNNTIADSKRLTHVRSSWAEYLALTRPRLTVMVLFTVASGFCMASTGSPDPARLLHTVFGTALVVAGATALNLPALPAVLLVEGMFNSWVGPR